jgi:predicted  nucleic acid-binding Zn-ribbon protein
MQDLISYLDVKVRALLKEYKVLKEERDALLIKVSSLNEKIQDKSSDQDVVLASMIAEDLVKEIDNFEEHTHACELDVDGLPQCEKNREDVAK